MRADVFHPLIREWFEHRFDGPTEIQRRGWPEIVSGQDVLLAAPTGSGKTLAAFLVCLDRLVVLGRQGRLEDAVHVVYVSPLRALSNDMQRNLETPLREIRDVAVARGEGWPAIRTAVRTGDTSPADRQAMLRRPPHILVTTPESLYLMLTGPRSRGLLRSVQTVIVDEIHALARDKRGAHLALSLERLDALCACSRRSPDSAPTLFDVLPHSDASAPAAPRPQRIGLSATQRPIEEIARFLVGSEPWRQCRTVDLGSQRELDLAVEVPPDELGAVCTNELWQQVYHRLAELIRAHRSTLIFVNTRRLAERVTHQLTVLLGEEAVASHHGSLSQQIRHSTERRLKAGQLKAVVATASLELGIDIGHLDLVCQIGSPRALATLLQRVGRSGHALGVRPKGRLFALTRDELLECLALACGVQAGLLDRIEIPEAPLDILAQQIVAELAVREWSDDGLYTLVRRAWCYRNLPRASFEAVVDMLADGIHHGRGRSRRYIHRDRIHGRLWARGNARLVAATCGGAIPDAADYRVVTDGDRTFVGTVDEDFAVESLAGDVFLLGNTSWRIQHVRGGEVTVVDARGAPPTIPFWRGEAPGRTVELSAAVSWLRDELSRRVDNRDEACRWLQAVAAVDEWGATQAVRYVAAQKSAVGLVPTCSTVVFERFFDEAGGMQLVIHAPFGIRRNRAWGLALRKCFCRTFNFELQASADDDGIVLSLGPQHSFPLEQMFGLVTADNLRHLLEQAVLAAAIFNVRWRWNASRALAILRQRGGKRVPPHLQRMYADDLIAAVFPMQAACLENVVGDIEIPDHPLVTQTLHDCFHEAMDVDGLIALLKNVYENRRSGAIREGEAAAEPRFCHASRLGGSLALPLHPLSTSVGEEPPTVDATSSADLRRVVEAGMPESVQFVACDTREPSPFAYERLNANPYAFLDDAPLEERRARAVATRRSLTVESVSDLGRLDPEAIRRVREEAWPTVRNADELHDALWTLGAIPEWYCQQWGNWFQELVRARRAAVVAVPSLTAECLNRSSAREAVVHLPHAEAMNHPDDNRVAGEGGTGSNCQLWIAAERWPMVQAAHGDAHVCPELTLPATIRSDWTAAEARLTLVRGWMECTGPTTAKTLADVLAFGPDVVSTVLEALEGEGCVLRGRFSRPSGDTEEPQWCDRRLLARIHRLTLAGLRRQIEPVPVSTFLRFLARHQHLHSGTQVRGIGGVSETIGQLQGFEAPAVAWESHLLAARIVNYLPHDLDDLTLRGQVAWARVRPPRRRDDGAPFASLTRVVPISLMIREDLDWLLNGGARAPGCNDTVQISSRAELVLETLRQRGALFWSDLLRVTGLLPGEAEAVLGELVTAGLVTSDGFAALRALIQPLSRRSRPLARGRGGGRRTGHEPDAGRWALLPDMNAPGESANDRTERWCRQLLVRYGVVFRELLGREVAAPPWRELAAVLRRLEARGEIRGGRFVADVSGEQYALERCVDRLRRLRDEGPKAELLVISAADPLNLVGILTAPPRVPAAPGNVVAYLDGRLAGFRQGRETQIHNDVPASIAEHLRDILDRTAPRRRNRRSVAAAPLPCSAP